MGALKDRVKEMSKFLILDKGESVLVQFVGWKVAADQRDPTKEVIIYEFLENGRQKFWTNSSNKVALALDVANKMEWVRVSREKMLNKAGEEVADKSSYKVEVLGDRPPEVARSTIVAPQTSVAQTNGNPGGVTDPSQIADPFA